MKPVYIVAIQRSAVTKGGRGAFATMRPDDLLAEVIKKTLAKVPQINPQDIEDVIIGCAMPEAEQGMNIGRMAALLAGLPNTVCGMTINRFCSSGLQSIALAADRIALGQAEVMLSGGVESMSFIPMGGHHMSANPRLLQDQDLIGLAYGMGMTAENVAKAYKISRQDQDQFALESHQKACHAKDQGWFADEVVGVESVTRSPDLYHGKIIEKRREITDDEGPRTKTNLDALTALPPVFAQDGSVTAGNTSQISDGAAMAVLVSEDYLRKHQLEPMARFCGFAIAGVAPEIMGIGPVAAIPKVLKQTGLALKDIASIELNEAFAAQAVAVIREAKLNQEIVNPQGGAIALGHPLGATGTIRAATLIHRMRRHQQHYGMVTMCIGGGMGAAGIFSAV